MDMKEFVIANSSDRSQLEPGENVWVHVDVLIANDVCCPGALGSFKRGFGENAQMVEKMPLYNMVTEAGGKNEVVSVDKFTVKLLEDKTYLGYVPVYSDKDVRFIQNYSFDVSKLNVMVAKSLSPDYRFDVSKLNTMVAQPLSPDNRYLVSECKDAKIKRVHIASLTGGKTEDSRGLTKYFLATVWVSATNSNFPGRMWHKKAQIYFVSPYIAAASAMIGMVTDPRAKRRVGKMILFGLRGTSGFFCSLLVILSSPHGLSIVSCCVSKLLLNYLCFEKHDSVYYRRDGGSL